MRKRIYIDDYCYLNNNKKVCLSSKYDKNWDTYNVESDGAHDSIGSDTTSNAFISCVNDVAVGTGPGDRIGRAIRNRKLVVNDLFIWNYRENSFPPFGTEYVACNALRFSVIWDKQPNGGPIPTHEEIFATPDYINPDEVEVSLFNSPLNMRHMDRFEILFDKIYTLNPDIVPGIATTLSQKLVNVNEVIDINRDSIFNGPGGSTSSANDISTGALYVSYLAFRDVTENYIYLSSGVHRVHYSDN